MIPSPRPDEVDEAQPGEVDFSPPEIKTHRTPLDFYTGGVIHFWSDSHRQPCTEDPLNSCLASRLLSGR